MLVKWLPEQFWSYCSYIYVLIETADERHTRCLCNVSKQNRASAPFIQRRAEQAGFIFKSTSVRVFCIAEIMKALLLGLIMPLLDRTIVESRQERIGLREGRDRQRTSSILTFILENITFTYNLVILESLVGYHDIYFRIIHYVLFILIMNLYTVVISSY